MQRKDEIEVLKNIKLSNPYFEKDTFLEAVKYEISNIYNTLCKESVEEYNNLNCYDSLIKKILSNKEQYRINKDIDTISIQYVGLHDYIGGCIQVYLSVYFYDKTSNNEIKIESSSNKYYNDIWIASYKKETEEDLFKCNNCGAIMKKSEISDILECPYCKNKKHIKKDNWKLYDIDVV